jgi:hypothetical protein
MARITIDCKERVSAIAVKPITKLEVNKGNIPGHAN